MPDPRDAVDTPNVPGEADSTGSKAKPSTTRKRSRKTVAAADVDAVSPDEAAAEPKRKRSTRRAPKASLDAAEAEKARTEKARTAEAQPDAEQPARPAPAKSKKSAEPRGDGEAAAAPEPAAELEPKPKKKRRRRRGKKNGSEGAPAARGEADEDAGEETEQLPARTRMIPEGEAAQHVFRMDLTFEDLGLHGHVLEALRHRGFRHPTKIQAELIPVALKGKDVLGQAKTGTGKTLAFGIPLLNLVEPGEPVQAIVLAPTRELAVQIQQDLEEVVKADDEGHKVRVASIYGGQKISTQQQKLAKRPEIIVGTPGRVLDMIGRGYMSLSKIRFAVLDEVDRMFDIGFRDDIRKILKMCPESRQTLFVSATISPEIEDLARRYMNDPVRLTVSGGSLTVEMVKQQYVSTPPWDKRRMLVHLLQTEEPAVTIVFCRMKRTVDDLVAYLHRKDIPAVAIHGDMSQSKRNQTMQQLKGGKLKVLVASDLASRGIDVEGITHVINYDLPEDPDLYVHRIGRTARAGREGVAWSIVTPEQGKLLTDIELLVNAEIPRREFPDFEFRERPDNWRDEPKPNQHIVENVPEKVFKSRYAPTDTEELAVLSEEQKAVKFANGVVPKKLPPKRLKGKVRTRR